MLKFMSKFIILVHLFNIGKAQRGWRKEWRYYVMTLYSREKMSVTHVAQRLKRLPAMQETWVRSLGREDPLEKKTATHSSFLAWSIPWTEEPGGLQSMGSQGVGHN